MQHADLGRGGCAYADDAAVDPMTHAGADQYLIKSTPVRQIAAAIRALAASER